MRLRTRVMFVKDTTYMLCVVRMMELPRARMPEMTSHMKRRDAGSIPVEGSVRWWVGLGRVCVWSVGVRGIHPSTHAASQNPKRTTHNAPSKNSTGGSEMVAMATLSFRWFPPDKLPAALSAKSTRSISAILARTRRETPGSGTPLMRANSSRCSRTVSASISAENWGQYPMRCRSWACARVTLKPAMCAAPLVGGNSPESMESVVVCVCGLGGGRGTGFDWLGGAVGQTPPDMTVNRTIPHPNPPCPRR